MALSSVTSFSLPLYHHEVETSETKSIPLIPDNPWPVSLSQKGVQGYLEDANPVAGTGHSAWGERVVTLHLGVGDVGPGHIQKVDSTPGWCPA